MQRHLHFWTDNEVKLPTPLRSLMHKFEKRNLSSTDLNEKHTFMELMINMQVSRPVTAAHMTVQECTNVFKVLYIQPIGILFFSEPEQF